MFEELTPRQVWVYGAYAADDFAEYERYSEIADISEVFDDVVDACPSLEFIKAARLAARRFPKTCQDYNIFPLLDSAEKMIH